MYYMAIKYFWEKSRQKFCQNTAHIPVCIGRKKKNRNSKGGERNEFPNENNPPEMVLS
jgi:hypothetical protein